MNVHVSENPKDLGQTAGRQAGAYIREAIASKGSANIILATGTSQFETLKQILQEPDIDWNKVVLFHLDEYIDLPVTHGASFRKYLKERFVDQLGTIGAVHYIDGEAHPEKECLRLAKLIKEHPIDVAMIGIGENGHLAFNDPPADFETKEPFIVVELDDACKKQQLGEGWFASVEEVPDRAISMSIHQILLSKQIICSVPDQRKAPAVKNAVEGAITNLHPASILQRHNQCTIYLDQAAAEQLSSTDYV